MKHLRALLMAVALSVIVVGPVKGDWGDVPIDWSWSGSGGSNFATTASVRLNIFKSIGGDHFLTIYVTHGSLKGEIFYNVGLINLPEGIVKKGSVPGIIKTESWSADGVGGWGPPPPWDLGGDGLDDYTFSYVSDKPQEGLTYGQSAIFTFGFLSPPSSDQLATLYGVGRDGIGVGIHAIGGPNGCSTKLGVFSTGAIPNNNEENYLECTPTVVPEPSTVILLGTGLVGLFGVAWRRRREDEV